MKKHLSLSKKEATTQKQLVICNTLVQYSYSQGTWYAVKRENVDYRSKNKTYLDDILN